jgi:hypothetical protein
MKHIHTFEEFLNEAKKSGDVITIKNFTDTDHTRLIKWISSEFGNKYNPGMKWTGGHLTKGGEFTLDVSDWNPRDRKDLEKYLKSLDIVFESVVNEANYGELMDLVKKGMGWATVEWVRQCPINRAGRLALAQSLAKEGRLFSDEDLNDDHHMGDADPREDGIKPLSVADLKKVGL